jgi:predicted porin
MTRSPRLGAALKPLSAAALLAIVASGAQAQSSVTLFGIIDAGVRYVDNGHDDKTFASSSGLSTSRFGVRGIEDLGGGLRAGFWLESGISPDQGKAGDDSGRYWDRRSTVSLMMTELGEVRLGRDVVPTYSGWLTYNAFGDNGVAQGSNFTNKLTTDVDTLKRADNLVQYFLPGGLSGVYGNVAVAAGEGKSGKKYIGGRLGYAAGPLDISGSYGQTDVDEVTPNLATEDDRYKMWTAGASYDFGVAKVLGYYMQEKTGRLKLDVAHIGALIPFGPGTVRVGYTNVNGSGPEYIVGSGPGFGGNDANAFALGYVYDLSKRTALYGTVAHISNDDGGIFNTVSNSDLALPMGENSTGVEIGIRHSF